MTVPPRRRLGPILIVVGTRPEAVKLAPVILALRRRGEREVIVCHSGQHQDLFADAMDSFGITPDVSFDTMVAGQDLPMLYGRLFTACSELLVRTKPETVVVQGDTATAAVAGWAAFLNRIEVAHVEAGLRSGNKWHPFPEEVNRRITGVLADWHFAPTPGAAEALVREGVPVDSVVTTGNTVVDALLHLKESLRRTPAPLGLDDAQRLLLITAHRRENFGSRLVGICHAVREIARKYPDLRIVMPVHPNPEARSVVMSELGSEPGISLCGPLSYRDFVAVMLRATIALSDSGGIQEEAPCLGLPVLVMRDTTERPEGVTAGAARLIGTDPGRIVAEIAELLDNPIAFAQMARPRWVYGDGHASERIADVLLCGALQQPAFFPAA